MKTRLLVCVLLVTALLDGCIKTEMVIPQATEVRPGVYMSNDSNDFAFPTSGYNLYFVGESHGNRETKLVFQAYLKKLHSETGLRDVILEEDQAYETEANEYARGMTDESPAALCLRADILGIIREFNSGLSDDEKVTVHLVDVDSPLTAIYQHTAELYQHLGMLSNPITFPNTFSEFQHRGKKKMYELIDQLQRVSVDRPDIINGLDTARLSLDWYYLGNRLESGWPVGTRSNFGPIREDIITKNIEFVLSQLNGRPVLAFFGLAHGMKTQGDPNPPVEGFRSWGSVKSRAIAAVA